MIDDQPIGVALNRNLGSPTAPGEAVEAELDRLIQSHEAAAAHLGEAEASNTWSSRYAKTGSGIVPRLSTSTAPRYEVCRCRAIRTD